MSKAYVTSPKGQIVSVQHKNGKSTMELRWNKGFSSQMNRNFQNVQEYVDSTVIRYMTPYTPMLNGILYKSAILGTTIGSGEIIQVAPYARYLYYGEVYGPNIPIYENEILIGFWSPPKKHPTGRELKYNTFRHPLAGKKWFERMKADKKDIILRGAQQIISR